MSQNNIRYFAVMQNEEQAIELNPDQLQNVDPNCLAIYRVDFDINDMSLEDIYIYLPAYHNSPNNFIKKSGISFYSGIQN